MACACKNKKNSGVTKTPVRNSSVSSNGKTALTSGKRLMRREIK